MSRKYSSVFTTTEEMSQYLLNGGHDLAAKYLYVEYFEEFY